VSGQVHSVAFTAVHPDLGRLDATRPDLGVGLEWAEIHRVRPRIALICPECGFGVHAKLSPKPRRLRYFAHDRGRVSECQLTNESIEHHLLKLELATAIRDAGWHAELEVRAPDGSWRADVMASSHDGTRRWAWEAQLSAITDADLLERTRRYAEADIEVCWVSPHFASWINVVPAVCVAEPKGAGPWTVADGIAGFDEHEGSWLAVEDMPLKTFVGWALEGKLAPQLILRRYRRVLFSRDRVARRNLTWTTEKSVAKQLEHEEMRQRQEATKAERERKAAEAEARRLAKEQAEREEAERLRNIEEEARRAEEAERARLRAIQWEKERLERQERQRQAEAERAERERLQAQARAEREEAERRAAVDWWAEISPEQWQELQGAIIGYCLKHAAARAVVEQGQTESQLAYGVVVRAGGKLYGLARPHPGSLHRLTAPVRIFVRNAREAELILAQGKVDADRVIHFGLPDHEQLQLY
jgi:competence protein CoiA